MASFQNRNAAAVKQTLEMQDEKLRGIFEEMVHMRHAITQMAIRIDKLEAESTKDLIARVGNGPTANLENRD